MNQCLTITLEARYAKKLVWHLKSMYPEKGAAHLWKLLHSGQTDEELMDLLDPDDDIYEIDRETIYWNIPSKFNTEVVEKTTGRRRFENVVSDWIKFTDNFTVFFT